MKKTERSRRARAIWIARFWANWYAARGDEDKARDARIAIRRILNGDTR